jgi:hypothetical protein
MASASTEAMQRSTNSLQRIGQAATKTDQLSIKPVISDSSQTSQSGAQ